MELETVDEIAAKLKLKKSWVYANADKLGAFRLGKYLRVFWPRVLECLEKMNGALGQSHYDHIQPSSVTREEVELENKSVA